MGLVPDGSYPASSHARCLASGGCQLVKVAHARARSAAARRARTISPVKSESRRAHASHDLAAQLTNARGLRLECSMWHRARLPEGGAPCVVYLHGNASCRAEALQVISAVLATGASLFAFDFAGCGQSEGEYISLGWHEQDDVQLALEHLRASGIVTSMALWGRSMGACAAVMHASRDPGVAGIVADSPFASLEQVAMELVQHAPNVVDGAPTVPPMVKGCAHFYEWNARCQLTTWKPVPLGATREPRGPIDYASKHWSGLLSGYYADRAKALVRAAKVAASAGQHFDYASDAAVRAKHAFAFRIDTVATTPLPTAPVGNALTVSRAMRAKYAMRFEGSCANRA